LPHPAGQLSRNPEWRHFVENGGNLLLQRYRAAPILRNTRLAGLIISFFQDVGMDSSADYLEKDKVLESWGQFASLAVERRGLYEQLSFRAQYDSLTALLNRVSLYERLGAQIYRSEREGGSMAVVYLDLDNFKEINDRYGHGAGDLVLQNVSRQILNGVRHMDIAARIGGDEFVIILPGIGDRDEASRVGDLIVESISRTSSFPGCDVNPDASFGISIFPEDGNEADTLLKKADEDMYREKLKRRGPNRRRNNPALVSV
jgi:diguanylate cyclase (GGDEF)-like protein